MGSQSLLHELPEWVAELLAHHGLIDANLEPERMRTEATCQRPDGKRVEVRADAVTLLWPPGVARTVASPRVEQTISSCDDAEQLERWLAQTLCVDNADALLDG